MSKIYIIQDKDTGELTTSSDASIWDTELYEVIETDVTYEELGFYSFSMNDNEATA
jgi:hypothetical protein